MQHITLRGVGDTVMYIISDGKYPYPIQEVSPALAKFTGYTREEMIGQPQSIFHGPLTEDVVTRAMREAFKQGSRFESTITNYKKNGEPFTNKLWVDPVHDDDGNIKYFVSIVQDITCITKQCKKIIQSNKTFMSSHYTEEDLQLQTDQKSLDCALRVSLEMALVTHKDLMKNSNSKNILQEWVELVRNTLKKDSVCVLVTMLHNDHQQLIASSTPVYSLLHGKTRTTLQESICKGVFVDNTVDIVVASDVECVHVTDKIMEFTSEEHDLGTSLLIREMLDSRAVSCMCKSPLVCVVRKQSDGILEWSYCQIVHTCVFLIQTKADHLICAQLMG